MRMTPIADIGDSDLLSLGSTSDRPEGVVTLVPLFMAMSRSTIYNDCWTKFMIGF